MKDLKLEMCRGALKSTARLLGISGKMELESKSIESPKEH
jgi:hypothetical protein